MAYLEFLDALAYLAPHEVAHVVDFVHDEATSQPAWLASRRLHCESPSFATLFKIANEGDPAPKKAAVLRCDAVVRLHDGFFNCKLKHVQWRALLATPAC